MQGGAVTEVSAHEPPLSVRGVRVPTSTSNSGLKLRASTQPRQRGKRGVRGVRGMRGVAAAAAAYDAAASATLQQQCCEDVALVPSHREHAVAAEAWARGAAGVAASEDERASTHAMLHNCVASLEREGHGSRQAARLSGRRCRRGVSVSDPVSEVSSIAIDET